MRIDPNAMIYVAIAACIVAVIAAGAAGWTAGADHPSTMAQAQ